MPYADVLDFIKQQQLTNELKNAEGKPILYTFVVKCKIHLIRLLKKTSQMRVDPHPRRQSVRRYKL